LTIRANNSIMARRISSLMSQVRFSSIAAKLVKNGRKFDLKCGLIVYDGYPYFFVLNFITMHPFGLKKSSSKIYFSNPNQLVYDKIN